MDIIELMCKQVWCLSVCVFVFLHQSSRGRNQAFKNTSTCCHSRFNLHLFISSTVSLLLKLPGRSDSETFLSVPPSLLIVLHVALVTKWTPGNQMRLNTSVLLLFYKKHKSIQWFWIWLFFLIFCLSLSYNVPVSSLFSPQITWSGLNCTVFNLSVLLIKTLSLSPTSSVIFLVSLTKIRGVYGKKVVEEVLRSFE